MRTRHINFFFIPLTSKNSVTHKLQSYPHFSSSTPQLNPDETRKSNAQNTRIFSILQYEAHLLALLHNRSGDIQSRSNGIRSSSRSSRSSRWSLQRLLQHLLVTTQQTWPQPFDPEKAERSANHYLYCCWSWWSGSSGSGFCSFLP